MLKKIAILAAIALIGYSLFFLGGYNVKSDFKAKHLEKLATDMLKRDEKMNQLKGKTIDPGFLNLF